MKTDDPEVQEVRRVLERQITIRKFRIEQLEDTLKAVLADKWDAEIIKGVLGDESWRYL